MSLGTSPHVFDVVDALENTTKWDLSAPQAPPARGRRHLRPAWLVLADVLALGAALATSNRLFAESAITGDHLFLLVVAAGCTIAFARARLYDRSRIADGATESRLVAGTITKTALIGLAASYFLRIQPNRAWVLSAWLFTLCAVSAVRFLARAAVRAAMGRGMLGVGVLIVGADGDGRSIARTLARGAWLGYRPLGFVAPDDDPRESIDGLPVLGRFSDVAAAVRISRADAVLVETGAPGLDVDSVCDELRPAGVDVRLWNGTPTLSAARMSVESLDGRGVLAIRRSAPGRTSAMAKRAFDVVGALILLFMTAPVMLATALAVRISSGAPVIYRHMRVGERGRLFRMLKFRTMVRGAEEMLGDLRARNEADGLLFKLHDDPRVTAVGRHLRRWAIDELPQLWNVLRGDMSLVGPRPALPAEALQYDDVVARRLRLKPGLTGLWQVNGRHELTFDDYVRYDLFYVTNRSLALDLSIVLRTIPALLSRRGAY